MPEPVTCTDLIAAVVAHPVPVIFLDTAAILDVLRVPFRHELQADIIHSAVSAVSDAAVEPKLVWLVTTANVVREIEGRRESVTQELTAHIQSLRSSMHRVMSVARIVFPERRFSSPDLLEVRLEQRVLAVMDRLVESTVVFRGSTGCVARARDRVWAAAPPASRANQEFKDCEIFEEFLELTSALRGEGFELPAVFVTPNSRDYGTPPDGHPQIGSDLAATRAYYAANLSWARSLLAT